MGKTICLNMIVKDEKKVIQRCLNSIKEIIDYWVIVDTGSTDGTQALIKKTLRGIPGELHERPWVNFGHNRNEALKLAETKADYILFIDADEQLFISKNFSKGELDKDFYLCVFFDPENQMTFPRILLAGSHLQWSWEGIIHEYLISQKMGIGATLQGVEGLIETSSSARSQDPKKYYRDAALLEEAIQKDPHNPRNVFYLAQSYSNAKEYLLAIKYYEKRALMGGCPVEVFWALFAAAKLRENLSYPLDILIKGYLLAYEHRPSRAEPLYYLASLFLKKGNYILSYLIAKSGYAIPLPTDNGYIEEHTYGIFFELLLAESAFHLKKIDEALPIFRKSSTHPRMSLERKKVIFQRIVQCERILAEAQKHVINTKP